jgi:hypothetical protein
VRSTLTRLPHAINIYLYYFRVEIKEEYFEYPTEAGSSIWVQEPECMKEEHLELEEDQKTASTEPSDNTQSFPDAILDHIGYSQLPSYYFNQQSKPVNADTSTIIKKFKREIKTNESVDNVKKWKFRQLTGKLACKYCDTIFRSKNERDDHECPYLQCDPRNFICRVCSKELSRKTFSNHLHETLDCQYCFRKFINPRNLTRHIAKNHNNEDELPPKEINREDYIKQKELEETDLVFLNEETGVIVDLNEAKKKNQRKIGKFECDK